MLVVLFGPSGVGKTSLIRILVRKHGYRILHTYTTRPPRGIDDDRRSVSEEEFNELELSDQIASTSTIFNYRYGADKACLHEALANGSPVYLVDFALENWQDLAAFGGSPVGILVLPPSKAELVKRLRAQNRENRLEESLRQFDFCVESEEAGLPTIVGERVVTNGSLSLACDQIHLLINQANGSIAISGGNLNSGFMADFEILEAINRGEIFERGTWSASQIHQASYGLRFDDAMVSTAEIESLQGQREYKVVDTGKGAALELSPGDSALLYSIEAFRLPANIVGFTLPRGLLVAQSLAPGASYVDPGFSGRFCVPVTNTSNRIVRLSRGLEIARTLFFRLNSPVRTPWSAADATSLKTALEAAPGKVVRSAEELKQMSASELLLALQATLPAGGEFSEIATRVRRFCALVLSTAIVWPVALIVMNSHVVQSGLGSLVSTGSTGFVGNVIAGMVTTVIVSAIAWSSRRMRRRSHR
jgi:deoxycytidine triphosphate deaminase